MKLAEMVRQIESLQDMLEKVTYQLQHNKGNDRALGGYCALLKVNGSKVFHFLSFFL